MLDNFFVPARRVIFFARQEAGRLGADAIGTEHLLLGFLVVDGSFFAHETAIALRQAVAGAAASGDPKPDSAEMPLAAGAKSVFSALDGDESVQPLHILRELLGGKETFTGRLLEANGVTAGRIEAAIQAL